jgi:hypothetical protein
MEINWVSELDTQKGGITPLLVSSYFPSLVKQREFVTAENIKGLPRHDHVELGNSVEYFDYPAVEDRVVYGFEGFFGLLKMGIPYVYD